ncbi:hybrid sensor histidine kinase/response regulator transcription factor [Flavobacterium marginilacus]|uniref:hybrid sensor histidine kinase/response regulator transcription factor n=1 Tax=Flavobacterium marginilacus TaxID=3003256 RepID=UPI00248E4654|nr:hybrid sensor histidine kinase/response regulator transcription factor [Flavobacterium marginilacus]
MHLRRTNKKHNYIYIIYFMCLANLNAQNLFFEKITGRDIKPVTQIHGIVKDSLGYIWIGSWNGAYRYDGRTFDFFYHNPNDKTSLPNNRIRNIVNDKTYGLWFFTFERKYVRFNYKLNSFKAVDADKVPRAIVEKVLINSNTLNKNRTIQGKKYSIDEHLFTVLDIQTGKKYQYTANINNPGQLLDDYITDFFIDEQNIIWLGTRGGDVYKANPNRNPFELHYSFTKGSDNTKLADVRAVTKCKSEVWLGTDEGILIYKNNKLDSSHPFYRSNSRIKNVRTLFKDSKDRIWIGGISGLECYDPKTNQCKAIINNVLAPKLETWSVFALKTSEPNYLWVGLFDGIAQVNLADLTIRFFDLAKDINGHSVMDILSVSSHELWLATEGSGIITVQIDNKGEIHSRLQLNTFQKNRMHISDNIVFALHKDKRGIIWTGTSEGLNRISIKEKSIRIEKVQLLSEIPNTYISSITDDNNGNLWIAHKQGISMVDIVSNRVSNYQKEDLFGSWTFSERAFYKDTADQKIYFGDRNGYVVFNPDKIKNIEDNNKLIFKNLYISNEKVIPMNPINGQDILTQNLSQTQQIKLDYENRNFTIELASLNYSKTNKEVLEYMLEGYEDKWIKTSGSKITYNKIPPGSYTFKAHIVSPNDTKSTVQTLGIQIGARWFETWLAKALFLFLLIGTVYWVFKEMLDRDRLKNEVRSALLNAQKEKELNLEKLEFFTNISHDLKTPLTLIADPIKQLENKQLPADEKALYFSIINRNLNYLTKLIQQILDFRKSEIGKLKLNISTQDFNAFITECYNTFKYIAEKRSIDFKLQIEESSLNVYLDFEKTDQILINILSNALKYTPDGGKVLFSAFADKEKNTLEIIVEDNGIGIEAQELEKIFEPFNNTGPSPFHGYSSGIGLSLTKSLVDFLGGSITIESGAGTGTKACIILPYAKSEELPVQHIPASYAEPSGNNPEQINTPADSNIPTLLIVEDNPDVQAYLHNELKNKYIIIQEYNGKKGLETAIQQIPDLVISDIMMPEMEGTQLCRELKTNESTCHIPIILLTAKGSNENQIEGYELGAEAYVTKPFSVEILKAQIKSVLENRTILLNRLSSITNLNQLKEESADLDKIFIEKVTDIISSHIEETDLNPEILAQKIKISQRQLYRKIKAVSGSTVHEFITKVRMEHAADLLKNSDLNISQIAYKVGFTEASNFSRTFSKHFGCSPSQYSKS